ncbi:hypothetical protein V1478_001189 [Vespula squamosa]|uniref:Uncharacterized protein n=1 Tax=Vespula squamosa TaxID=30214 RepID=A0ABD2C9R5_VESSQ
MSQRMKRLKGGRNGPEARKKTRLNLFRKTFEIALMATERGNLGNQEYPSVLNTLGDIFQELSRGYNSDRGVAIP